VKKLDQTYISKFENLDFAAFKRMALDATLLPNEKIGFPEVYRKGKEQLILQDILSKLTNLKLPNKLFLDIGPGCSELPKLLLNQVQETNSKAILCDCQEMLSYLPDASYIQKIEGPFPKCWNSLKPYSGLINSIVVYSVLHYVSSDARITFLDRCFDLLAPGGQLLIGDLPNYSKRVRFFSSQAGIAFHQEYTGTSEMPNLSPSSSKEMFDDESILHLVKHVRARGFDAYVLPQANDLPMANRREDILIARPQ